MDKKFVKSSEDINNVIKTLNGINEDDAMEEIKNNNFYMVDTLDKYIFNNSINDYNDEICICNPVELNGLSYLEFDKKVTDDENTSESMQQITKLVNNVSIGLEQEASFKNIPLEILCNTNFAYGKKSTVQEDEPIPKVVENVLSDEPYLELLCSPGFVYGKKRASSQPQSQLRPLVEASPSNIDLELLCAPGFAYARKNPSTQPIFTPVSLKKMELELPAKKSTDKIEPKVFANQQKAIKLQSTPKIIKMASKKSEVSLKIVTESVSSDEIVKKENTKNLNDLMDDIYYYRELLIRSYEGLRVDLLTITSFHGIQMVREKAIEHLFPEKAVPRSHTFKNKKVI
jgi:hypothetical protein